MHIEIDTATITPKELDALSALIDVLAGRSPNATTREAMEDVRAGRVERFAIVTDAMTDLNGEQRIDAALQPVDHSDEDAEIVDAAVAAGAPTHDSAGLPWDERIHASSRATIADGTWRRRKNTPDDLYDKVMAELRGNAPATGGQPSSDDDTPPPPASTEPAATASAGVAATTAAEDVPPPPTGDGPDLSSFAKFVSAVNGKDVPAEKKTYQALNDLCSSMFGVAAFKDMKDRQSDWPMFYDMVG